MLRCRSLRSDFLFASLCSKAATAALLSAVAFGPACSCQREENIEAKKRLSAPV